MVLQFTLNRIRNAENRIDRFRDQHLKDWLMEEIIRPTQKSAFEFGLGQNAVNGMTVEKTDFLKAKLVWEYRGPNDEPLHIFLERGFAPHSIQAKGKEFGGADTLSWIDSSGKRVFRFRVQHPGFEGYHIMENGWKNNKEQFIRRMITETNRFLETQKL